MAYGIPKSQGYGSGSAFDWYSMVLWIRNQETDKGEREKGRKFRKKKFAVQALFKK
jgi:hypothetical protein